jgi:hypothetical protein
MAKAPKYAMNRGSCVYLGGSRVRFLWACGCKRAETVKAGVGRRKVVMTPDAVRKLAAYWRSSGVILPQCKKHPDWYSRESAVPKLNERNPDPSVRPLSSAIPSQNPSKE